MRVSPKLVHSVGYQRAAARPAQPIQRRDDARDQNDGDDDEDGESVAERDGRYRQQHLVPAALLKPERYGEQPAHGGVEAVIRAQRGQRDPRP